MLHSLNRSKTLQSANLCHRGCSCVGTMFRDHTVSYPLLEGVTLLLLLRFLGVKDPPCLYAWKDASAWDLDGVHQAHLDFIHTCIYVYVYIYTYTYEHLFQDRHCWLLSIYTYIHICLNMSDFYTYRFIISI